MKLGEKIALLRKKAGLSQEELAARLGISRQAVSRWETGSAQPDLEKVIELARLFSVTTDYLLLEEAQNRESTLSPSASDLIVERKRKFRIAFGIACVFLGLVTAISALFLAQSYAQSLTEWWTDLGRFGTALQSFRGVLLGAGCLLFLAGCCILLREYFRKD